MVSINTKKQFYTFYSNNTLINKIPTWYSFEELKNSSYRGKVGIRLNYINKKTAFNIPFEKIPSVLDEFEKEGISRDQVNFVMAQPDHKIILLGETKITEKGLYLMYSTVKKPMKNALKEETKHAFGLEAKLLLKNSLWPQSYSELMTLFELFPDSVIEFTAYSQYFGLLPNRNTIFWEVRNY